MQKITSHYLHIPFCHERCHFCKFAMTHRFARHDIRRYLAHLTHEIRSTHDHARPVAETIYLGGGTPSILERGEISSLLDLFDRRDNAEVTLECNPEDISITYLEGLRDIGITRLSVGIQSLHTPTLEKVGRGKLSPSVILERLDSAQKIFGNISVDLIIGLPRSTREQVLGDIETIVSVITPPHMSLYLLEAGVYPSDWGDISMSPDEQAQCYIEAVDLLKSCGLERYEVSNFAKAGYPSKHNQNYWTHRGYYGYGLSASSLIAGVRSTWSESFAGYYRREKTTEILSTTDQELERMIFAFRQNQLSDLSPKREVIIALKAQGHIEHRDDGKIQLTSAGILAENHILSELF